MKYNRPLFRRIGSKYRALPHIMPVINSYLKADSCFVDACCGTGVVSMNISNVRYIVVNDKDQQIINFYRAFRDDYDALVAALKSFHPSSRAEFENLVGHWHTESDPILRIAKWYLVISLSYLGRGKVYAVNYDNKQPGLDSYLKLWPAIRYRINQWQLECGSWSEILKYDSPRTVWYFDPEYLETAGMSSSEAQMQDILDFVSRAEGMVILNHYPSQMIDDALQWSETHVYTMYGSAGEGSKEQIVEKLWVRF